MFILKKTVWTGVNVNEVSTCQRWNSPYVALLQSPNKYSLAMSMLASKCRAIRPDLQSETVGATDPT